MSEIITPQIEEMFGREGRLSRSLPGFEYREGQMLMADAVFRATTENRHLVVEAGTGTGKSLAYLIPGILSGRQIVVSTVTKNLQEQLFYKDIPFIQKKMGIPFTASALKGRANYLCLRRYQNFLKQPFFDFREEARLFDAIAEWVETTRTGDRAELDFLPDNYSSWSMLCSSSETCIGKKCKLREDCYFEKAKAKARESDVIIINHHLFFADLALKKRTQYVGVLPEIEVLIMDEAHEIEDVATNYFGLRFSYWQVHWLALETERELRQEAVFQAGLEVTPYLKDIDDQAKTFFNRFRKKYSSKYRLQPAMWDDETAELFMLLQKTQSSLSEKLGPLKSKSEDITTINNRWKRIFAEAKSISEMNQDNQVYWAESTERNVTLAMSPIEIADELDLEVFQKIPCVILTSATLSTNRTFDFFKSRVGVKSCQEKIVESPFDFMTQAVLYVPRGAPDPRNPAFDNFVIETVENLLMKTEGKAFVLFTSIRRMQQTYRALSDKLPFTCLLQGTKPRHLLINTFKKDLNAVLFATSSFWHGVDVVGPSLSCVIIDKIPFSVPDEPVVEARIDFIKARGGNSFVDFMVPSAIITLKQGIGRLIRSKSDTGIIAILDPRFYQSSYAHIFQKSLPPITITTDEKVLNQWAKNIRDYPLSRDP